MALFSYCLFFCHFVENPDGRDIDPCNEKNFGDQYLRSRRNNPCGGESCVSGNGADYTCRCRAPFISVLNSQNRSTCVHGDFKAEFF